MTRTICTFTSELKEKVKVKGEAKDDQDYLHLLSVHLRAGTKSDNENEIMRSKSKTYIKVYSLVRI